MQLDWAAVATSITAVITAVATFYLVRATQSLKGDAVSCTVPLGKATQQHGRVMLSHGALAAVNELLDANAGMATSLRSIVHAYTTSDDEADRNGADQVRIEIALEAIDRTETSLHAARRDLAEQIKAQ